MIVDVVHGLGIGDVCLAVSLGLYIFVWETRSRKVLTCGCLIVHVQRRSDDRSCYYLMGRCRSLFLSTDNIGGMKIMWDMCAIQGDSW